MSVLVAASLDLLAGEPPAAAHPVVWTGRYLERVGGAVPAAPARRAAVAGGVAWAGGAVCAVAFAVAVERAAHRLGTPGRAAVRGLTLWPLLSARMLLAEVARVESELERDLAAGRAALARIVSRDTSELSPEEVRSAAVESLSENLSDSLVAPLVWFLLGGLPAAALYRYSNTADACWGYRTRRWVDAGRVAARADDALNLLPARLTALLLLPPPRRLQGEARRTSSPNAGWPMAAMALRLDVRLAKRGHHELNPAARDPRPGDVTRALRLARRTTWVAVTLASGAEHLIGRRRRGPR